MLRRRQPRARLDLHRGGLGGHRADRHLRHLAAVRLAQDGRREAGVGGAVLAKIKQQEREATDKYEQDSRMQYELYMFCCDLYVFFPGSMLCCDLYVLCCVCPRVVN